MSEFIDFGRFSTLTEDKLKEDKELFLIYYANECTILIFPNKLGKDQMNEEYMDKLVKMQIKRVDFTYFMTPFGISYNYLDKEEKEQFKSLFFSYDNIKEFTLKYQKKYIDKCKSILPEKIKDCFNDICFVIYCHIYGNPKIDIIIFIRNIRDYFILDKKKDTFEMLRNDNLFYEIRTKMLAIYPELKREYIKRNVTFEKFLSYIDRDNDYNYKILRDILNNDSKNVQDEYVKLKEKQD